MALQAVTFPIMTIVKNHLIVNCVFVFIALFVVGLRLFARFMSGAKLWWDDYLILFSVPQGIGMLVIQGLCRLLLGRNGLESLMTQLLTGMNRCAYGGWPSYHRDVTESCHHLATDALVCADIHIVY